MREKFSPFHWKLRVEKRAKDALDWLKRNWACLLFRNIWLPCWKDMRTYWNIRQLGRRARLRLRGDSLKRMLRGSSRNINCWKFSSLRTGHATQPTRGAGKRKKVFVVLRDKIFFPRARWTFFFDFRCELFKRLDAQSIRVVLSLFITRDFEISREKRTSRNRFVRSSAFFFLTPSPFGASRNDCSE